MNVLFYPPTRPIAYKLHCMRLLVHVVRNRILTTGIFLFQTLGDLFT